VRERVGEGGGGGMCVCACVCTEDQDRFFKRHLLCDVDVTCM
jgi:hypothetical protein